ncbi:tetratricopeptide repeat protein [Chlorobium sp. N1]|uniref:tetratricopeptide repeat protein n=1 Tax=Chlorobium sp. N1 TaxID=2491138 RepID=UPI00325BAE3E
MRRTVCKLWFCYAKAFHKTTTCKLPLSTTEAEPLYRRAVRICEQSLGASHPNTITTQNNLEVLLEKMKD